MTSTVPEDHTDRLEASDPRWNVALEASAGTGKTSVLVDRYIHLLEEGAEPRHILAITFTRKAAGEMKGRIIDELRRNPPLWQYVRQRLFDIHIATIDAFCMGLLKEFPLEAGLDPDVELLDEVETERLVQQAVDEALTETACRSPSRLAFLLSVFGEVALRNGVRDFLSGRLVTHEALARFVHRRMPRGLDLEAARREAAAGLRDALGGKEGLKQIVDCGPSPVHPQWTALADSLHRAIDPERATALDIRLVGEVFLTQEGSPRKRLHLFTKKDFRDGDSYERHRDLVLSRAVDVAGVIRRWSRARDRFAVAALWRLYSRALRHFSTLKEDRRGLDFTDVLVRAVELLEQLGEFSQSRFRLESRYHHILIDEFQDTNKFQWRLVTALIASWGEGAGLVQEVILAEQAAGRGRGRLREPTIFIVGDRKQSIYGWRDARVEVMETAARHIERLLPGRGKRLRLRQSFRAGGDLLAFLNDVFAKMPRAREKLEWTFRYDAKDHFPISERGRAEPPVGLAVAPEITGAASAVADDIVRLLAEEHVQPKDIAVLFRSRTHYRVYEKALAERGVPTYVYRGLGFFDSPEVRDVQALVRYLAEPGSELRAAELARSRFIRISDSALARLASRRAGRAEPQGPLSKWLRGRLDATDWPAGLAEADRATALGAAARVPAWLQRADQVPPAELIEQVLEETDYAAWLSDPKWGRQGWENLKKILEMIRRAQNRGYLTLARLAKYLEHASSGDESLAVLEAVDAVSLMTIHAAKGLEFEAAFVVNLDQKTRLDTSLPRIRELGGDQLEVHALERHRAEGPDRHIEEEKRLLYVALTRARSYLVLSAAKLQETEGKATLFRLLPEGLRSAFHAAMTTEKAETHWNTGSTRHRLRVLRAEREPRHYRRVEPTPEYRVALEPLDSDTSHRISVSGLLRGQSGEEPSPWALDPVDRAVGAAVHRLFEYEAPLDESLTGAARAVLTELSDRAPSEQAEAVRKVMDFYARLRRRDDLKHLLEEGQVLREVAFALRREGRIVYGAIDSLVLLADSVVAIDYKTGKTRPEHKLQMELYVEAARGLFAGRRVEGLVFYPLGEPLRVGPPTDRGTG